MLGMPDYFAFDEVDDFFGDMGRMIGQAFQMPGDQKQVDQVPILSGCSSMAFLTRS
jgi:hypothetical protein